MALRAEQWLMIAVGGLGAYAVYRLVKNSQPPNEVPILVNGQKQPTQPTGPLALAQNWIASPGQVQSPGGGGLRHGGDFKGRIELPPAGTPFPPMMPAPGSLAQNTAGDSQAQLQAELKAMGWDNPVVYMTAAAAKNSGQFELPGTLDNPTAGSRWFVAKWRGGNNQRTLPRQIVLLWASAQAFAAETAGWGPWGYYPAYSVYRG